MPPRPAWGALKTGNVIVNTFKGIVVDGYITGGTVFADANRNSVLDEGEFSSTTDSSGNFEILGRQRPLHPDRRHRHLDRAGVQGHFEAPPRAKVINPLTTLLSGVAGLSATDAQIATAQTLVKSVLKLDSGIDLLSYDPIVEATTSGRSAAEIAIAVSAQGEAAKIANLLVQGTSVLAGAATSTINTGDAGRAILAALSDTVKALPAGATIDLASAATIEDSTQRRRPPARHRHVPRGRHRRRRGAGDRRRQRRCRYRLVEHLRHRARQPDPHDPGPGGGARHRRDGPAGRYRRQPGR